MDEVVSQLLSYKTLVMMTAVTIGTFFVRRIVETAAPSVKQAAAETAHAPVYTNKWSEWWNKVILYAIPVVLGIGLTFGIKDFMPMDAIVSKGGLAMYGAVCGWLSSFGYKVLRKSLKAKTGVDLPSVGTLPPISGEEEDTKDTKDEAAPAQDPPKEPPAA